MLWQQNMGGIVASSKNKYNLFSLMAMTMEATIDRMQVNCSLTVDNHYASRMFLQSHPNLASELCFPLFSCFT